MKKKGPRDSLLLGSLLALVLMLVLAARCKDPAVHVAAPAEATAKTAHIAVVNEAAFAWQLVVRRVQDGRSFAWEVPAAGKIGIELVAGGYEVEQTALGTQAGAPRRFPMTVAAGQNYRWRLASLLGDAAARPPAFVSADE